MKFSSVTFLIAFFSSVTNLTAQRLSGGVMDTLLEQMKIKVNYPITRGAASVPTSHSLLDFAPPIQSQGSTPSCIPWATAYAGMTIVKRIEQGSLEVKPFSAMNLYNRVRPYDALYNCNDGSIFFSNITLVKSKGVLFENQYHEYCENLSGSLVYTNKLHNYEDLSVTAWNIKYAIARNRPVMIGMKMYTGEYWGTMSYHETGIWNGLHTGSLGWNHGMLVVGYDDNVAGGAFLIMNSWGTDFGKDGYFWLQYKHVASEIRCAYAMIPKVDNSHVVLYGSYVNRGTSRGEAKMIMPVIAPRESVSDSTNTVSSPSVLTVQNKCGTSLVLAVGQGGHTGDYSKGWYLLAADADQQISIRSSDSLYMFAEGEGLQLGNALRMFSVNQMQAFEYRSALSETKEKFAFLGQTIPSEHSVILHCENAAKPTISISLNAKQDTSSIISRNKEWNGKDLLYDPLTLQEIKPDENGNYTIFLLGKKMKPKKISTKNLLKMTGVPKFATEESALEWK